MSRGRREAVRGRQGSGDPFAEESRYRQGAPGGTRRPVKKKKKRKRRSFLTFLLVAAALTATAAAVNFVYKRPNVSDRTKPVIGGSPDGTADGTGDATGEAGTAPGGRKEDYYTFLLLGRDTGGGGNTDTIILVSYDVPNQQVNMMSIPRDTAINVSWGTKKINSVYNAKESSGGGIENLKQQVAYLTGVMPDFYAVIEWKAVGRVVEAVGGVEFDVPRNMNYDDPYQDLHIHLNKGVQKLNGQKAMEMLRYRHDNDAKIGYDDTGRMNTQKAFLKAMAKEVLKLKNMTKIGEFINIFMENVETDLKLSDLTWFASKALGVDTETMQSSTLPYMDIGQFHGAWYFLPNGEEIIPLVNEQFNPYNRDITANDLQLLVRRDDGSCYVTNGTLLDSKWGKSSSGGAVRGTGGGVTTETSTGVTASQTPSGSSSGGTTGSSQTTVKPTQTDKPADSKPSSSNNETTVKPNNPVTPDKTDKPDKTDTPDTPALPDPVESQPTESGGGLTPTEPANPDPEPEPNQNPAPDPDPEPILPPEPELPTDSGLEIASGGI